jgi:hypothetical protein
MNVDDWLAPRIPAHWQVAGVDVVDDQDEILIVLDLGEGDVDPRLFRESTRDERMALAAGAEAAFGRKVSWGARCHGSLVLFTTLSVPVMTRLRLPERQVLDTLIDGGLARTRSEALGWCVRLVGENEKEWIADLREAFRAVEAVRQKGPASRREPRDR